MRLKVFLLALVLAISFAGVFMPEAKAEGPAVTPYANMLLWTGYTMYDKYAAGGEKDTDLVMDLTPQGSFGVRGVANGVFVEFSGMARTPSPTATDQRQLYLFLSYMKYTVSGVELLIGQFFTPYDQLAFGNVAGTGTAFGWDLFLGYTYFDAARVQFRATYQGFYGMLVKNAQNEASGVDVMIPMLAVGYQYGNPGTPMSFGVHGLFQTYKIDDGTGTGIDGTAINSYGGSGDFSMKMAPVTFQVHGHYGINTSNMGVQGGGYEIDATDPEAITDTTTMSGFGQVQFAFGAAKLSAGVAYKVLSNDNWDNDDPAMAYFVSLRYDVQPNFAITPCIQINDNMKDENKVKEGKTTVIGFLAEAHI